MSHFVWWALVLACAVAQCSAEGKGAVLLSSKIEIEGQTAGLVGEVTHHGALFGSNWYGETIESILYYTQRPLCNDQIPDTPEYIKENEIVVWF